MGRRNKKKPMIPRKNRIFEGEVEEEGRQRLFEEESCRGAQNELSMAI
jgi:hypothetical protein